MKLKQSPLYINLFNFHIIYCNLWSSQNYIKFSDISIVIDQGLIKRRRIDHFHVGVRHTFHIRKVLERIWRNKARFIKTCYKNLPTEFNYSLIYIFNFISETKKGTTAADIPVFINIRSTAYRLRSSVLPPTPKKIENIVILDNVKSLKNAHRFVILDNRRSRPILIGVESCGVFWG